MDLLGLHHWLGARRALPPLPAAVALVIVAQMFKQKNIDNLLVPIKRPRAAE